jgi:hypothetical protein
MGFIITECLRQNGLKSSSALYYTDKKRLELSSSSLDDKNVTLVLVAYFKKPDQSFVYKTENVDRE